VLDALIAEAAQLSRRTSLSQKAREDAYSAWTYFNNHRHRMDYPGFLADNLPIGSGVTEAACKSLVKQRLCASGMRWKNNGARIVLSLRALTNTVGRWTQFWQEYRSVRGRVLRMRTSTRGRTLRRWTRLTSVNS
jgi:hypothetical protein